MQLLDPEYANEVRNLATQLKGLNPLLKEKEAMDIAMRMRSDQLMRSIDHRLDSLNYNFKELPKKMAAYLLLALREHEKEKRKKESTKKKLSIKKKK